MADVLQEREILAAIGLCEKGRIRRVRTLLSFALLGATAIVPLQSIAQTVAWKIGNARQGASAMPDGSMAVAMPGAPPPAFLFNSAVHSARGSTTNADDGQGVDPQYPTAGDYYDRFQSSNETVNQLNFAALTSGQSIAQIVAWPIARAKPAVPVTPGGSTTVAAPNVPPPAFLIDGAVDIARGYTTNADNGRGTSTGTADAFTRGRFDLGLHYVGPHLTADAHYSLTGYYYDRVHSSNEIVNRGNFAANSEVIPDHLFVNVSAFAAPTALSRVGRLSPDGALVSNNNSQSYGFVATPILKMRLGEYAVSQTSLSESAVFFSQPSASSTDVALPITPAQNTNSTTVAEQIVSEPYFGRFRWALTGSYTDTKQTTQSQQQTQGRADLAYAIDRVMALLVTVGYSRFTSSIPLTQSLSGPIALGGVRFSYGPTFTLVAEAGTSSGFATYLGSLNWNPTPTFSIIGSLTDTIASPQANILNNLSTLAASAEGVFSDAQSDYRQTTGQALFPQTATVSPIPTLGLALDNSIYRNRSAQLAFSHQDERNQYGLSFFGDMRDRLSVTNSTIPARSSLYGARLYATRKLRRDLTGHAGISYSYANEFGGHDRIFVADSGLSYMLTKNLSCYITAQYLRRQSSGQIVTGVPFSDFLTIVGTRRSF